jgi:hypothetical protein
LQGTTGLQGPQGVQGPPGPTAVSANAGNSAILGTDGLTFVPQPPQGSSTAPLMNGTATPGSAVVWSRGDHVHPTDTSRMPIAGTIAGDNAVAGNVGEFVSASQATGVTLTTVVAATVVALALNPGDWDVWGQMIFNPIGTQPNNLAAAVSRSSAALPTPAQLLSGQGSMTQYQMSYANAVTQTMQTGLTRISTSTAMSAYLVALAGFSGGSCTVTGFICARRVR